VLFRSPQYHINSWMDEAAQHYAIMLKTNKTLNELHMQKCEMRDYGAQWFSEKLVENRFLVHLDLSCNRITRDGANYLSIYLKNNTPLKILDLGNNRLEDDGAIALADALIFANCTLERLSIKSNKIGGAGLCALAEALKYNSVLSHVYIWGNILDESACIAFSDLLNSGRLQKENVDVQPYVVDDVTYLSELSHGINMYYYWQPTFGESKDIKEIMLN